MAFRIKRVGVDGHIGHINTSVSEKATNSGTCWCFVPNARKTYAVTRHAERNKQARGRLSVVGVRSSRPRRIASIAIHANPDKIAEATTQNSKAAMKDGSGNNVSN
jgi:hypothetical protein